MPPIPVSFRWPAEFVERIDGRRGKTSRSAFVRAAVEAALSGDARGGAVAPVTRRIEQRPAASLRRPPTSAEAKAGVKPIERRLK